MTAQCKLGTTCASKVRKQDVLVLVVRSLFADIFSVDDAPLRKPTSFRGMPALAAFFFLGATLRALNRARSFRGVYIILCKRMGLGVTMTPWECTFDTLGRSSLAPWGGDARRPAK